MPFKVRKGYTVIHRKTGKPMIGLKVVRDGDPVMKGQEDKFEPCEQGTPDQDASKETSPELLSAELRSIASLPRARLIELYKQYVDPNPPEDITVPTLRDSLKEHYDELMAEHSDLLDAELAAESGAATGEGDEPAEEPEAVEEEPSPAPPKRQRDSRPKR